MKAPIYEKLIELKNKDIYPFHMPGHKRNKYFIPDNLIEFDITEIDGFDNLHNSLGIIKESENIMANIVGADESFYLINGSSCGMIASIISVCKPNDKIIVARNCHKSVYTGIILAQAYPIYIYPKMTPYNIFGGIDCVELETLIEQNPDLKAVVITSPTYEGFCSDISSISEIVHKRGIPLIVDEAHGAHFCFSSFFPKTAISCGADISVQSWHKTMPVLTQTAILNLKSKIIDKYRLKQAISMLQSTSPSYIMMAVLDYCQKMMSLDGKEIFKKYTNRLISLYKFIKDETSLCLFREQFRYLYGINDIDKSKIVIYLGNKRGVDVEKFLLKNYNIAIEMSAENYIILMTSLADTDKGFNLLKEALCGVDKNIKYFSDISYINRDISNPILVIPPYKSFNTESESIPIEQCAGLICAEFIIPYPPGIPIVIPGEIITYDTIMYINSLKENGISIIGTRDRNINNIQVHI